MPIKRFALSIMLIITMACSIGCDHAPSGADKQPLRIITASIAPVTQTLYFSGTIKPLKVVNIPAPADGVITKKNFSYGQSVKPGDELFTISSSKLHDDYQNALVQYLKAKSAYFSAKQKFIGTQELMQHELISKNTYDTEKNQLASFQFDYLQAKYQLQKLLDKEHSFSSNLSLEHVPQAAEALKELFNEQPIMATASGIVLMPLKSSDSNSGGANSDSSLELGSQIKAGENLLTIGDMTGIGIDIQIPEINMVDIKPQQKVTITGVAFPGTIVGQVDSVGAQARTSTGGMEGLPTFTVHIIANHLSPQQRRSIHVGMSAKIAIELPQPPAILIPLEAVYQKNNLTYVDILNAQGKSQPQVVSTGKTTETQVVITKGLRIGDKVIVPKPNDTQAL